MADDLNDFLRQAALRREARKRAEGQGGQTPKAAAALPPPPRPIASQPTAPARPSNLTSHPKSVESGIEKADRRREEHRQEVFGDKQVPLQRSAAQQAKQKNKQPTPPAKQKSNNAGGRSTSGATSQPMTDLSTSGQTTSIDRAPNNIESNEILKLLRNPQTLKTAFIASEIFGRKFD